MPSTIEIFEVFWLYKPAFQKLISIYEAMVVWTFFLFLALETMVTYYMLISGDPV